MSDFISYLQEKVVELICSDYVVPALLVIVLAGLINTVFSLIKVR